MSSLVRWRSFRTLAFLAISLFIVIGHASYIIPGLLAGKRLIGPPTSGAIYTTGGFHCSGDGPWRIHYHTCQGDSAPLPQGTKPDDYPFPRDGSR